MVEWLKGETDKVLILTGTLVFAGLAAHAAKYGDKDLFSLMAELTTMGFGGFLALLKGTGSKSDSGPTNEATRPPVSHGA